jgi:hypothetical protein
VSCHDVLPIVGIVPQGGGFTMGKKSKVWSDPLVHVHLPETAFSALSHSPFHERQKQISLGRGPGAVPPAHQVWWLEVGGKGCKKIKRRKLGCPISGKNEVFNFFKHLNLFIGTNQTHRGKGVATAHTTIKTPFGHRFSQERRRAKSMKSVWRGRGRGSGRRTRTPRSPRPGRTRPLQTDFMDFALQLLSVFR